MIDLRSDTVTRPTTRMLEAMMQAEVGDDVFHEDPTVRKLETMAAQLFGKEAGLYCPSGTMTNQIAMMVHTRPGDEVICYKNSHVFLYEGGGMMANSGASPNLLDSEKGQLTADQVEAAIKVDDPHFPNSRLVSLENTVNKGGGSVYSFQNMKEISERSRSKGLAMHLDGARIYNAIVESDYDSKSVGGLFDSISVCLSKGLGAPIGSLLLGEREFIHRAHRTRKRLGGGMRQVGYLAAAGIYALENHVERLTEDHENARLLASWMLDLDWVAGVNEPETNIVIAELNGPSTKEMLTRLNDKGILAVPFGENQIRLVTHLDITEEKMMKIKEILPSV
jgi:threonine aldolase